MSENPDKSIHPSFDIPLFIGLIPLINLVNYFLTYKNIQLNFFFGATFLIDTLSGYLAWGAMRQIVLWLDRRLPYSEGIAFRLIVQLALTTLIGISLIALITELSSFLYKGQRAPSHFYTHDLGIISIWSGVINGIYMGAYFYQQWQSSEARLAQVHKRERLGFVLQYGNSVRKVPYRELSGFFVEAGAVWLVQSPSYKYALDDSLEQIFPQLPQADFFRLNRQFILHRSLITGFQKAENGKLRIQISPSPYFPPEIAVSRTKAPAFKRWFQQSS